MDTHNIFTYLQIKFTFKIFFRIIRIQKQNRLQLLASNKIITKTLNFNEIYFTIFYSCFEKQGFSEI